GLGNDRGPLAFWRRDGPRRGRHSSAEHCPFNGRVRRRLDAGAVELFQHAFPDSICGNLARPRPEHFAAARFFEIVEVGIFHAALRRLSRDESRAACGRDRWHITRRDECRERDLGRSLRKTTINGVQYSLGSLPFGGFVALPQLAPMDIIEGKTDIDRAKLPKISALDKIIVAIAGPLFSLLLALCFAAIVWAVGHPVSEAD